MPETISTLLYGSAIDLSGLERSAREARAKLESIGDFATKTFDQKIRKSLANSIVSTDLKQGIERANTLMDSIGIYAGKSFKSTLGANLARQTLSPFVDESSKFLNQLKQGFTSTLGVGKLSLGVGLGNILADVVRGLGTAAKEALVFSAQFETALTKIKTIADKGVNFDKVREDIKQLATEVPQNLLTLSEGLFNIIGSGIRNAGDAFKVLDVSARAATAGFTDTKFAADAIVFSINAFGKSVGDAEEIANILFKTVDVGKIEFNQLAANIGEVANPAAIAGVSLEELGQAIATITLGGTPVSETFTSLKNLLQSIVAPTEGASKAAKALGIEFSKAGIAAAGGLEKFIQKIREATGGDTKKLDLLFPEARALRAAQILTNTLADTYVRLGDEFDTVTAASGEMNTAFEIANQTAENQYKLFKNNLGNAVESVGNSILRILLPALQEINELFDDTNPIDKLIKKFQALGTESAKASAQMLIASRDAEKTKEAFDELNKINLEIAKNAANLEAILDRRFKQSHDARNEEADFLLKIAQTEDGRDEIQRRIQRSVERETEISKNLVNDKQQGLTLSQNELVALNIRVDREKQLRGTLERILQIRKEEAVISNVETKSATPERPISQETTERLKQLVELSGETAEAARKELKIREDINAVIEKTGKQLELISATTPFERSLIEIKQSFDELREQVHGSLAALKQIAILEQKEIDIAVDKILKATAEDLFKMAGGEERIRKQLGVKIELLPEIDFKLPKTKTEIAEGVNEFDEQLRQLFRERNSFDLLADSIRNRITPIFAQIVTPVDEFLKKLEDSGIATRDEFVELADIFDRGLGNFVFALNDFVKRVSDPKGTILGSLIGGINLVSAAAPLLDKAFGRIVDSVIGGFTGSSYERKKAEAERRAQEASEAAAQAAQRAADALENLRREAEKFSAGELTNRLNALNEEFETLTNASTELTSSEQARALALVNEIKFLDVVIKGLEARLREATDPEDIANIRDQLNEAQEASNRAYAALGLLGININNLTAAELERIRIIVQETKIIEDAIKAFDAFGDGFRGFIDQLNLGFELLNIENPAIKLQELLRGLVDTFGFKVPKEFENLREFILGGFRALKAGGKELADFLIAAGLEEFTPEDFADLLKLLNEFSKVSEATTEARNAFSDLVESLQLEFELLNVDDPIKKLERLRAELLKKFNSIIPTTKNGLDDLINQGFLAFQAGGDALKDFLTKFGLEELIGSTEAATRQQLEDLLRTLRGFANDLSGSLDDVGKQAEDLTISQVKSITYFQGNKLIDEATTIRIVVTQMLDQMRNSALATPKLGNLAAALTGLNNFAPQNNYYIINNGTLQKVSENQLSDIDRRLIQQSRAASQARGIG